MSLDSIYVILISDELQDNSLNRKQLAQKARQLSLLVENYEVFFNKMTEETEQARQQIEILRNRIVFIRNICQENATIECPIDIVGTGE